MKDCRACFEPQHCDCLCKTCIDSRNSLRTKCIAPECNFGLVFGETCKTCKACKGTGFISNKG
jgi:hypothetical protein